MAELSGNPPSSIGQAPSDRVAERRVTSILFADLVGFTPFAEHLDPEEVRDFLSGYFDRCREIVLRYGGTVEKFIGDAVMAVWGVPTAHEDDAERSVRAGLELVEMIESYGQLIGASELQIRVGIASGEVAVTIGAIGEGMVSGDAVNTASRVQAQASPGQSPLSAAFNGTPTSDDTGRDTVDIRRARVAETSDFDHWIHGSNRVGTRPVATRMGVEMATAMTTVSSKGRYRSAFRYPDLRRMLSAFTIIDLRSWSYTIVIAAYLYAETGSAKSIATLAAIRWVTGLAVNPHAGVVADRYDRRTLLTICALITALLLAGMTVIIATGAPIWMILVLSALMAVFQAPNRPAAGAMIPEIVEENDLVTANVIINVLENLVIIAGPLIGGLLILTGNDVLAIGINALGYGVAAALYWNLRIRSRGDAETEAAYSGCGRQASENLANGPTRSRSPCARCSPRPCMGRSWCFSPN